MKIRVRLLLLFLSVSCGPLLLFAVVTPRLGFAYAGAAALAAALLACFFAFRAVTRGFAFPVMKLAPTIRGFISGDYKLESAVPRTGWPECAELIVALNRLMLELSAYRAFHLNQVVEDRAKAQALIETITDGVLLTDDRGGLIYSNQRALGLLGIPKTETNIRLPESVAEEAFVAPVREIMTSGESYLKFEVDLPGNEEAHTLGKSFRVTSRQFDLATLKRPGRVIAIRDITLEREIESARETFFHMITHDMRAPVCSIQGYAQLLSKRLGDSPAAGKFLQAILYSANRLNGMIGDILNTIKLERGEMRLETVSIEAEELCARVFEVHSPLADRKRVKFSLIPEGGGTRFTGDASLLERVISNLVGNSLKFTPSGGEVSLFCGRRGGEVLFAVRDDGPGIPRERREEIFEKHAQLEEHKHMGFGLGLAMCKMAVELHGGRIWVESEEGKGSCFMFAIPAK